MSLNDPADSLVLDNGAKIAVIGGGPSGSFFSIFAMKMAKMLGKEINVTIFDPKDFRKDGPGGCNRCGGIISELLVQTLAVEGINLPNSVVRKGINSYKLHTELGGSYIATPDFEKTIATVYRGGGPKGMAGADVESFDDFLLSQAVKEGAAFEQLRVDRCEYRNGRPVVFSQGRDLMEADLVVGAFGVNSTTGRIFEDMNFGYKEPVSVSAAIAEIKMDEDVVAEHFGNSIHLFLVPDRDIKFAAMIPKGPYVTLCMLGKNIDTKRLDGFLQNRLVQELLPDDSLYSIACRCIPKMNVKAPKKPFADRVVMCGDSGSTRLFKDGLGAAYVMGKAVAKTAVFEGVGTGHFHKHYYPVYRDIIIDNYFGTVLYTVIEQYRRWKILTRAMLNVVEKEQKDADNREKILSSILWDMFTGNERYKTVFRKSLKVRMHIDMWEGLFKGLIRRES